MNLNKVILKAENGIELWLDAEEFYNILSIESKVYLENYITENENK